jgi:hypothetical protein
MLSMKKAGLPIEAGREHDQEEELSPQEFFSQRIAVG